jgi:hypothetical protein
MVLAADYPFLSILGTMVIFFTFVMWAWMVIVLLSNVFTRKDLGVVAKVAWTILLLLLPVVGALIYLVVEYRALDERSAE